MSHCFGAGINQMMRNNAGSYGGLSGFGGGASVNLASAMPSITVGQGLNARSYKNFYQHAYDPSGFARIPPSSGPTGAGGLSGYTNGGNMAKQFLCSLFL